MSMVITQSDKMTNKPVNLFWTGGWESTFRMLQLVLHEKRLVQPYYIIYPGRISLPNELRAMRLIRSLLARDHPSSTDLILPTHYTLLSDIKVEQEIVDAYHLINNWKHLGYQYTWLAAFCKQKGIIDMEMGFERYDNPQDPFDFLRYVIRVGDSPIYIMDQNYSNTPDYIIFGHYRFPLLDYTKSDIGRMAKKFGWWNIQKKTWFCHTPIHGRIPCGSCAPCKLVIRENHGRGVPIYIRILNGLGLTNKFRKIMHHALLLTAKRTQYEPEPWESLLDS